MAGHMGDTFPAPCGRRSDALAGDQSRARTSPFRPGPRQWPVDDDRTVPPLRHQPEHRPQVGRSLPPARAAWGGRSHPPADIVELILKEHTRFGWGARKILKRLRTRDPKRDWPARSTIFDILARYGRTHPRRHHRRWEHPGAAPLTTTAPNQIWTIDFKGQFRTRNGVYCYPLTLIDHFSLYM